VALSRRAANRSPPSGTELHSLGGRLDGQLVGITHYLFHVTFWSADSCYLQDLFVDETARGQGAARALIERVAEEARRRGAARLYWTTEQDNVPAHALHDKVAHFTGSSATPTHLASNR
jgi:GNAT superfamily N-acetyltransferase